MIWLENASLYGADQQIVFKDVSILIPKEKTTWIQGESGSGKTCLLRVLANDLNLSSGNIYIDNKSLELNPPISKELWRRKTSWISHHLPLLEDKSVLENVCFPMSFLSYSSKEAKKKSISILNILGIEELANTSIKKGHRLLRLLTIFARAISLNPKIIFMDDFLDQMSENHRQKILSFIFSLNDIGVTAIISSSIKCNFHEKIHPLYLENGNCVS